MLIPRKIIEGLDLEIFLKYPPHVRLGETLEITLTMLNFIGFTGGKVDVKLEDYETGRSIGSVSLTTEHPEIVGWNLSQFTVDV